VYEKDTQKQRQMEEGSEKDNKTKNKGRKVTKKKI
jgi:hypothetical protein